MKTGPVVNDETGEILAMAIPYIRTRYNYDRDAASVGTGLACADPTRTQQHFKKETDINTIVERFGVTGELPLKEKMPQNGDFSEAVTDYQTALNMVIQAKAAFGELPAKTRARFHNNPQELLAFLEDPENKEEARKLGLVKPEPVAPPPAAPIDVRVIADSPPTK